MSRKKSTESDAVVFLNPSTCGIYKSGGPRFRIDPSTGDRTDTIDNEMADHVDSYLRGDAPPGIAKVPISTIERSRILVPRYYDARWSEPIIELCKTHGWKHTTLGALEDAGILYVRGGHGSPSNDKRTGHIPYIKVSDIRSLRVNTNPTNLVSAAVAQQYWHGDSSGLNGWDLLTPNRASSNIGEFAVLLPGEEEIVVTKEVFVLRILTGRDAGWSPFYLLWALTLKAVRNQWQRVALMQTNREDVGDRYREIIIPIPPSLKEAKRLSSSFHDYFTTIATAKKKFVDALGSSGFEFIASAHSSWNEPDDENDESR